MTNDNNVKIDSFMQDIFQHILSYIGTEIYASMEGMETVAKVCYILSSKYDSMNLECKAIEKFSSKIKKSHNVMQGKLKVIDEIDAELASLEKMVSEMEKYTKEIELKDTRISALLKKKTFFKPYL